MTAPYSGNRVDGGNRFGRSRLIPPRISANNPLGIATSASRSVIQQPWRTTLAPILMRLLRGALSDQSDTSFFDTDVASGLVLAVI